MADRGFVSRAVRGVSALERVEALIANPALYELADLVPEQDPTSGGRRRHYPVYMWLLYDALLSVYGSARQVEAEIAHPVLWEYMRDLIRQRFRDQPSNWLPDTPMRRHHYLYARTRWLTNPDILTALRRTHRQLAVAQARELELLDPDGPGSWTHPDLSRMFYADGKVLTPLFRAQPGDTRLDRNTGELRPLRAEPDGALHFEGTGETAWGTKWLIVAVRSGEAHSRIIVDADWVPTSGGEAGVAMASFGELAPLCPGAQGVLYDTALRGVHHQRLMRDYGLLPVNKVTAAKAGDKAPRRDKGQRVPKSTFVEQRQITLADGTHRTIDLFACDGAVGLASLTDTGEQLFTPLRRIRTHRNADKNGKYRWYNDFALPAELGGGSLTVRLHATDDDRARKFNRTENVRPIPASDPDFAGLYGRRSDAESINRALDDTLWLRRAHSIGHARQHLNLLSFALGVNSLARHRHGIRDTGPPATEAA
jgi:hypothetical protein